MWFGLKKLPQENQLPLWVYIYLYITYLTAEHNSTKSTYLIHTNLCLKLPPLSLEDTVIMIINVLVIIRTKTLTYNYNIIHKYINTTMNTYEKSVTVYKDDMKTKYILFYVLIVSNIIRSEVIICNIVMIRIKTFRHTFNKFRSLI